MNLLVTGGAGFIGSNFIKYWLNKYPGDTVVNFDALTYAGNLDNLKDVEANSKYSFVKGDITDLGGVKNIINQYGITHIVNFAAESHVDRSIAGSAPFIRTNILGTHTLLEAAREFGNLRFHQISTDEVFGSLGPKDKAFSEITPYDPRSPYSASKAAADHLVRAYFHTYNLPITISNCSNNYGPYQFPEKFHALCITNALDGKPLPVYGDGLNIRDWLYVSDHCAAIDAILQSGRPGESYCVGGDAEKTNIDVAKEICRLAGANEELITFVKDRAGHDKRYAMNFGKLKKELGWSPAVSFAEGMKLTVEWYKNNRAWWEKIKSGEYKNYYEQQYSSKK